MGEAYWRERLEDIVEIIPDGVVVVDRDGRIVFVNVAAEKVFGIKRAEIIGRCYSDLAFKVLAIDGKPLPEEEHPFNQVMKTGASVYNFEHIHERPDGTRVIVIANTVPLYNMAGETVGIVSSLEDITERKLAEKALTESERQFREMLEKARLVAVILDVGGRITFINDYLLDLTGRKREEVLNKDWFELFIPPEQQDEVRTLFFNALSTGMLSAHYENDIVTRYGDRRTISFNNVLLRNSQGDLIGSASIGEDITERKRATEEIRESRRQVLDILESVTDGFVAVDNDWRFTYVNGKAERLLERSKEQLLFRIIWDAFPGVEDSTFGKEFKRAVDEKKPAVFTAFYPPLNKWFEVHAYPYAGGLSIYFQDISERIAMENAFKREKDLSDALNSINAAINSTLEFDEIMMRVIVESAEALGVEAAAIIMRENHSWVARYLLGFPQELIGTQFSNEEARALVIAEKTKKPVIINDTYNDDRVNREAMQRFEVRSLLTIPLIIRGDVIGCLSFYHRLAQVPFSELEVDFANKLAASISLALENARLFKAERNIADVLQKAILAVPEEVAGIRFSHLYRFATEATRVGGDFYDIFELEDGNVGIVIGDVSSKGLNAAVTTSLIKNTIKAYAYEGGSPASIMAKTNDITRKAFSSSTFASVFFGILNTGTGALAYCSAGHPPGILRKKTSEVILLITSSPVIGAFTGLNYMADEVTLEKDDVLILYTNGVTGARCNGEFFGDERLMGFIKQMREISVEDVPRLILDEVLSCTGGKLLDDLALLSIVLGT